MQVAQPEMLSESIFNANKATFENIIHRIYQQKHQNISWIPDN